MGADTVDVYLDFIRRFNPLTRLYARIKALFIRDHGAVDEAQWTKAVRTAGRQEYVRRTLATAGNEETLGNVLRGVLAFQQTVTLHTLVISTDPFGPKQATSITLDATRGETIAQVKQ